MFRTLLTPLRSRFELASPTNEPSPKSANGDLAPEDFARDVLIQLMRNSVEGLKGAQAPSDHSELLAEIHRIMTQDGCTKDVFRELDGFLLLINVLSMSQLASPGPVVEPEEQVVNRALENARLAFTIASEAMYDHAENTEFFRTSVGYHSLADAIIPLLTDPRTLHHTLGLLLSFALHDFTLSDTLLSLPPIDDPALEVRITDAHSRLRTILRPGVVPILWRFVPENDTSTRYVVCKILEQLSRFSHRNQAILSSVGLVSALLPHYYTKDAPTKARSAFAKLLKRLLDMGATTPDARSIFQHAIKDDQSLDTDVLEPIRSGMKSRWPEHFSMETAGSFVLTWPGSKAPRSTGFSFMIWIWIEALPQGNSYALFTARPSSISLRLRSDGKFELVIPQQAVPLVFEKPHIHKARWLHVGLVHHQHKSQPNFRLFVDGVLCDTKYVHQAPECLSQQDEYEMGDNSKEARMSWCLASAYLLSVPIADEIPRLIHHLGPRYCGHFQDPDLVRFLTYEASTSLTMFLSTMAAKASTPTHQLPLLKAIKHGLGIPESSVMFSLAAENVPQSGELFGALAYGQFHDAQSTTRGVRAQGDVYVIKSACLDMALWRLGGAPVAMRLVQLAKTPHELSRSIGILLDGLRGDWQNSDSMERLRGYEILAHILRLKSHLVNMTSFETLFEFLGVNFRSPDQSTVVNPVAYQALGLDYEVWAHTSVDIQRVYLEHFVTLLHTSRYKKFNSQQRFAKVGLVRKLLFVIQTNWYEPESMPYLLKALKAAARANWTTNDAIKPLVTFCAANLHEDAELPASPQSLVSVRLEMKDGREKAEQVLDALTTLLGNEAFFAKFSSSLPFARIVLLLLGDRPSPFIASQVLLIVAMGIHASSSFIRKLELVNGWNILKTVLPRAWDPSVHEVAFDILLGRYSVDKNSRVGNPNVVSCPQIVPAIFSALKEGLLATANISLLTSEEASMHSASAMESTMEVLIEELIDLQSSSSTFRQIFKSQSTTQLYIDAYRSYVTKVTTKPIINPKTIRMLEKLNHFGLALALDNDVAGEQKRLILDTLQTTEGAINGNSEKTAIDPKLVTDARSIRQRIASSRLSSVTTLGGRALLKTTTRIQDWRKNIQTQERKRLRKDMLDLREHRRQIARLQDWSSLLDSERGLWSRCNKRLWRLDETEGPQRVRKKLEPQNEQVWDSKIDTSDHLRDVHLPDSDTASTTQVEAAPWSDNYEISATDMEDRQLAEEIADDKHRRVRHDLEPGDVIEAVCTVARIAGVDSSPGLLIIGKTHIYMLDGVVESDDGEVIEAHEAPKHLFFVPGSIVELDGPQQAQRWAHDQITNFSDKTFLFRDVGLEIYFKDSRSLLIVFLHKERRTFIHQQLSAVAHRTANESMTPGMGSAFLRSPLLGKVSARMMSGFRGDELLSAQRKWQAREISNFTYLSIINQISGRTPSDATQYPVFPWVLKDYTSKALDLTNPDTYRDLTKPMGALTPARREAAESRYTNLQSVDEKPFHYGTHFSSSMIVCHFLIRMAPFTNMFKTLQGGDWDLPDRLFSDIGRSYESASHDVRGDVRELIPEFFTCPEFLENSANIDFGVQQNTGERIHDAKLPPWAKQDPLLFIIMNRRALESDYVSEHLPAWIDLIWGCKQRDPEALNVFHPLSYEGSIDLDTISDPLEREATVGIIHNFGQTPRKLFNAPHPERYNHGISTLPIGTLYGIEEGPYLLQQANRCFKDLGVTVPVRTLFLDMIGERVLPCPEGMLYLPYHPHEEIEWGPARTTGGALRLLVDHRIVQVIEGAHCTCAAFADANNLVTGSTDYTVRLWKIVRGQGQRANSHSREANVHITLSHILRVHSDEVICVAASRAWSVVVSGSKDGSAALWDLNRGTYVQSIWHGNSENDAVHLVAINESTGYIATCSRSKLLLHTINARSMASLDLTSLPSYSPLFATITSLAFHEREYSALGVLATGGSDGTITLRTWTADGTPEGERARWEFLTMHTMKVRLTGKANRLPAVTALKFVGESICHGEETGKSFLWSLPE
ncbi:hypothetical protein HGRIS_014308 [Hohenbuehelia grisea]|uniref:Beach-domain-containing protein n=1 Tax=Hohenbuehelia grisea TaxID=104357 RepID=A0ABR3JT38_9AGAR